MLRRFVFLLALLLPSVTLAQQYQPRAMELPLGTLLGGVALNASASTRTITLTGEYYRGYDYLVLYVEYTWSAASAVTMSCTAAYDTDSGDCTLQDGPTASGTFTSSNAAWSKTVSASAKWPWRVNVKSLRNIKCVLAGTSADGSDLVTVKGYLVTD